MNRLTICVTVCILLTLCCARAELPNAVSGTDHMDGCAEEHDPHWHANQTEASAWYMDDWSPNFDGTHSQMGKTVSCAYESIAYGNVSLKVCPVCGDFGGERVALCQGGSLRVDRLYDEEKAMLAGRDAATQAAGNVVGETALGLVGMNGQGELSAFAYLTSGQYMVRILRLPEGADAAYAVSICHEIAGRRYDAECAYAYRLPIRGEGLRVLRADEDGHAAEIAAELTQLDTGLYFKPYALENAFGLFLLVNE